MDVGSLCKRNPVTVREFDELSSAARRMRDDHVGYLVVVEPHATEGGERPVGVLTDRDIVVGVVAKEVEMGSLRVGDLMTRKPAVVDDTASVQTALDQMRRIGVRRMPVVGRAGQLVGVLSLDDIIDALAGEMLAVSGSIRNELRTESALRR